MKNKIKELRKEINISQEELADQLVVSRQTIISLENGKYNASLQLAFKIAKFFHMPIEEIFTEETTWLSIVRNKKRILSYYR